jgi:hypothetical protein
MQDGSAGVLVDAERRLADDEQRQQRVAYPSKKSIC